MTNLPTLVLIGSGPGIGSATASLFASKHFSKIALISRDATRLSQDRTTILESIKAISPERKVEVKTWSADITSTLSFKKVLKEVETFGRVTCVIFNAARVALSDVLSFPEEEVVKDFMVIYIPIIDLVIVRLGRTD